MGFDNRISLHLSLGKLRSTSDNDHAQFPPDFSENPAMEGHVSKVGATVDRLVILISIQVTTSNEIKTKIKIQESEVTWYKVAPGVPSTQQTQMVCS